MVGESLGLGAEDRLVIPVPLYHCFGMVMGNLGCVTHGSTILLRDNRFTQMSKTSLDKSKIKFLLLEGVHQNAVDTLKAAGYTNIEYLKTALSGDELKERIADAHFIGIRSRTQLTEEVFDCAKKLIAVGCFCIGTNQVDLNAARERGIAVFNAPYSNTRSVAELVLAEAILLLRGIPEKNASCHRGGWIKSAANSFEIRGKKLGIVGYGSIGTQLSVLAEALGMQVFFYDTVTSCRWATRCRSAACTSCWACPTSSRCTFPNCPPPSG